MTKAQIMRVATSSLLVGIGMTVGALLADRSVPPRLVPVADYPMHVMTSTETWTERDFQVILQWERDGIFPRLGYDQNPPDWYVAEKKRRGIVVTPERIVTPEQFADPEFRRRHNR